MGFVAPLVIGIGALIGGSIIQANAAKKAAASNERAQREAIALQERTRQQERRDQLAQIEIGQAAARTLAGTATGTLRDIGALGGEQIGGAVGPGLATTFEDKLADFQLSEGINAINQAAALRGQFFAGRTIESIGRLATDVKGQSALRKKQDLFQLAALGTNAAANLGAQTTALAQQSSSSLTSIGAANAAGKAQAGAAIGGGLRDVGKPLIGAGLQSAPVQEFLNS